ncbi:MAG: caspase family protein, partial [bacterium]|nr:caspase family protein [bacterium]
MEKSKRGIGSAVVLAGAILSCTLPPDEAQEDRGVEVVTLPADAGGRWALVVGNAGYESGKLRNPLNDAADMAAMLGELGFAVDVLENAGHQAMEDAIRDFGLRLRKGGVGVFYYAGHAVQVDGVNYLVPVGAEIRAESE